MIILVKFSTLRTQPKVQQLVPSLDGLVLVQVPSAAWFPQKRMTTKMKSRMKTTIEGARERRRSEGVVICDTAAAAAAAGKERRRRSTT